MTHSHWFHPDEWCQTFEPANIIAHGFGVHSQEIGLHLRNLTWPVLLAGILKITHLLWPSSIDLRVFGVNALSGILDLLILWGWAQLLKHDLIAGQFSSKIKNWSFALLLLPWFSIYEAVSPRAEHLSEIAFWATLGCLANGFWLLAGLASVAIAAFRYPSVLLTATIFCFVLIQFRSNFLRFLVGVLLGAVVFGAADAAIYGRPWESFWMYLQYNLFTGSGTQVFGKKGIGEYLEIFSWNWRTYPILLPLGFTLLLASLRGIWEGIRRIQLWALCLVVYMIGHVLVPHKEGRFMIPVETLLLWAAFLGIGLLAKQKTRFLERKVEFQKYFPIKTLKLAFGISLVANCFLFLHALRADLWKAHGTYRELGSHLASTPHFCAVLAAGEVSSIMMPFTDSRLAPSPAFGALSLEKDRKGYSEMRNSGIIWSERAPDCGAAQAAARDVSTNPTFNPNSNINANQNLNPNTSANRNANLDVTPSPSQSQIHPAQRILLHTHRIHPGWIDEGCTLLPTGLLRKIPNSRQDWILQQGYKASTWYNCPTSILAYFGEVKVQQAYTHNFSKIEKLPGWGVTAKELEDLGHQTSPPPKDISLPTLANPSGRPL